MVLDLCSNLIRHRRLNSPTEPQFPVTPVAEVVTISPLFHFPVGADNINFGILIVMSKKDVQLPIKSLFLISSGWPSSHLNLAPK